MDPLQALHAAIDRWMEKNRLDVDFLARARPDFASMRQRLNSEPGLVISNRVGGLEPLLIARILERRGDALLVANGSGAEFARRYVGSEKLLQVSEDLDGARDFLQQSLAHMRQGKFVILFPSGKSDPEGPQPFRSGLRLLVKRMQPEWMVYAVHMHPDDAEDYLQRVGDYSPDWASLSAMLLSDDPPVDMPPLRQRFSERYTTAAEWQAAMGDPRQADANDRLHAFYHGLFPTVRRSEIHKQSASAWLGL